MQTQANNAAIATAIANTTTAKPTASEATAKPAKPAATVAAKPAVPATDKPLTADQLAKRDAQAERVALIGKLRNNVAAFYNGPSLAIRSNPKRIASSVYSALLAAPKHRTTLAKLSPRDESALRSIIANTDKSGDFDPAAINLDSGIFSRLCSVGFIAAAKAPERFTLTKTGAEHCAVIAKRKAA